MPATLTRTSSQDHQATGEDLQTQPKADDAANTSLRLVVEDPHTGEKVVVAAGLSWRAVEVLGEAGLFYRGRYTNEDWPEPTVEARKAWAAHLGAALWDAAVDRIGPPDGSEDLPKI